VDPERAGALRQPNHVDDGARDVSNVGALRLECRQASGDLRGERAVQRVVLCSPVGVRRPAGAREVVRAVGERARHDDGGVDAELDCLRGVADREGVHGCLGREVGREERRGSAAGAGAADPQQQPFALAAQLRQRGPVHALGAQDVGVIDLGKVFGGERLGRPEHHVTRVVHDHV
jgi:hypothetical protein